MANIVPKRNLISGVSSDKSAGATLSMDMGAGSDLLPLQNAYLHCEVQGEDNTSSTIWLDDGVTGLFKEIQVVDSASGKTIQRLRGFNVFQSAVHKIRGSSWANSVGKVMYGLEGKYVSTSGVETANSAHAHRARQYQAARKTRYMVNWSDVLPFDSAYPINRDTSLRSEVLLEDNVIAVRSAGGTAHGYTFKQNPIWVYDNILTPSKVDLGSYRLKYLSWKHHTRDIPQNATNSVFSFDNGELASVQGVLVVPRLQAKTAYNQGHLSTYVNSDFKNIQLTVDGRLYPQLPMDVSGGDTALIQGAEQFSKMKHLSKLLSRGSAYKIADPGVGGRFNYAGSAASGEDGFMYIPLSDMNASHGSGLPLSSGRIVMEINSSSMGAALSLDIFVLYDTTLRWIDGIPQVESLVPRQ